jgi:DNA-directed RNA polymerase subunit RPC12/RpoP
MHNSQSYNSNPGAPHVGVTQQAQRPSGMPCPQCGGFIPVSMQQIITDSSILCPHCGLRLNINQQESRPAIDALKKFQQAQRDFDKRSKNF